MAVVACTAVAASSCSDDNDNPSGDSKPDQGDFTTAWESARTQNQADLGQVLRDADVFEEVASALNDMLKLPRDLPIVHTACDEENAYYDPRTGRISMCYELLQSIAAVAYQQSSTEEELGERLLATWFFVFFHELGHGLIDLYDLPVTGKEEDAVDDFSAVLMIDAGLSDYVLLAAEYWAVTDPGMYSDLSYADEHSLNSQRFYSILCTVFGSDPDAYEQIVTQGFLPESRAVRCPAEYEQKSKSWTKLLEPWAK
jgi:hypothetical protein